jgi:hypothetical protein
MTYDQRYLDRFFFPVKLVKNAVEADCQGVVNDFTGQRIANVSNRYTLVQNRDLVQPVVDTFGIDRLTRVSVYNGNRSFLFEFLTGREIDISGGDILKEKILVRNSYDKTKSFSFMAGAFRMVCSNGLYVAIGSVIAYKKIHVGVIPVQSIVQNALNNFSKNDFSFWKQLAQIPLDTVKENELISKWIPYETKDEHSDWKGNMLLNRYIKSRAEGLIARPATVDNQRNAWGLYNQMNQAIDRIVPRGQVDKKIAGNSRMESYLKLALNIN